MTLHKVVSIALEGKCESTVDSRFSVRNADGSVVSLLNDDVPSVITPPRSREGSLLDDERTVCPTPPPEHLAFPSLRHHQPCDPQHLRLPSLASVASALASERHHLTPPATPIGTVMSGYNPSLPHQPNSMYLGPLTPCPTAPSSPRAMDSVKVEPLAGPSTGANGMYSEKDMVKVTHTPPKSPAAAMIPSTLNSNSSNNESVARSTPSADPKRKHHCTWEGCGRSFTTSGHLSRHHRVHTGEKNFPCSFPGCTSRFSRQDNMMQHLRTHTNNRSRANRRRLVLESSLTSTTSDHRHAAAPYPYSPRSPYAITPTPTSLHHPMRIPESPSTPANPHYYTMSYSPSYPPTQAGRHLSIF
ncbi:transcriptional repressor [Dispira simplex]|nr:transcriptional repressor [Dispira simplex]